MIAWTIGGVVIAALWCWRFIDARTGMRSVEDLTSATWDRTPQRAAKVSIIVAARDEQAHIERALRSMLALDYPQLEIIAVDDRSVDETGAIMDRLASTHTERFRVLHVADLPPGWLGKTHAMWLGARHASGEFLLFTDGDVIFRPDALRRGMAYREREDADHLVVAPEVPVATVGGRMLVLFFELMFLFGHRPWKVSDPHAPDSIGFGPFNLVRRSAYDAVGGMEMLRMAVVEDMELGELLKRAGYRQRFAVGLALVIHHWIADVRDAVRGLEKNFFAKLDYRPAKTCVVCALMLMLNLSPWVGAAFAPGWTRVFFVASLIAVVSLYAEMTRHQHYSVLYTATHPVASVIFAYILLRSMAVTLAQRGVVWRGVRYDLAELRAQQCRLRALDRRVPRN